LKNVSKETKQMDRKKYISW